MMATFYAATPFDVGQIAFLVDPYTVSNRPVGPMVGPVHCMSNGKANVMIAPCMTVTIKTERLIIDPIQEGRQEYRELGCTYTDSGDFAVCDYVDEAIDGVNATIDHLGEVVDALQELVEKQGRMIERLTKKGKIIRVPDPLRKKGRKSGKRK